MARGRKTGGRNFEPGNPGGPGHPKLLPGEPGGRKLTRAEFERIVNKYTHCTLDELKEFAADPATLVIDHLVIQLLIKAGQYGDPSRLTFLLDRLIGKVPDKIEHSGSLEIERERQSEFVKKVSSDPQALELSKSLQDKVNDQLKPA